MIIIIGAAADVGDDDECADKDSADLGGINARKPCPLLVWSLVDFYTKS